MAYIGKSIESGTFSVLDTSGNTYNGSNVTFNLGTQVGSVAQLLVSHDGVIQKPGTDYTLATGGTQITFTTAPASGASIFIVEISGAVGGPLDSDLNGTELILDADGDTSITADTDDQIDFKIAGADDLRMTANAINVLSGTTLTVDSGATITNSGTANGFGTDPDGAQVFNESGADVDFRVESDGQTHMFTVDGGNNVVGISSGGFMGDLGAGLHIKTADSGASVSSEADELVIEHGNAIGGMSFLAATDGLTKIAFGDSGNNDAGLITYSHDGTHMAFTVEGSEVFRQTTSTTKLNYAGTHDVRSYGWVANGTGQGWKLQRDSNQGSMFIETHLTTSRNLFSFVNGNGTVGTISTNSSSTSYNTSSDYRLKENVDYTFDATARLKQLKPARFNWIADDTNTLIDGFIAHEVSSIVPEAVTGQKDAMKMEEYIVSGSIDEGNAVIGEREVVDSQSIDQSKLVPLLVKTVQELEARIATLEG